MVQDGMVWWEIWRTRHNEVEDGMGGMRASNSSAAKVNTDCIAKNYPLSPVIIITVC